MQCLGNISTNFRKVMSREPTVAPDCSSPDAAKGGVVGHFKYLKGGYMSSPNNPAERNSTMTYLVMLFAFLAAALVLYFVGTAIYGGREFTISLLTSSIGVFFGAVIGITILLAGRTIRRR